MERIKLTSIVVCDAGPIIHLDEVGYLHLLNDFSKVSVTLGVKKEVLKHRQIRFEAYDIPWLFVPPNFPLGKPIQMMCQMFSLDSGEMEALSILSKAPETIFLTDDAAARLVATQLGYKVHGTIGVLIRTIRRGMMKPKEVIDVLNDISSMSTLYIKNSLMEEIITRLKHEYQVM
jgi:predicted nucleic acid-binding protein